MTITEHLLQRYQQRKARDDLRVDDHLYLELCQTMPEKAAQRIFGEFLNRRAHSNLKAEGILLQEIVTALLDAEHFASTAKPIHRPPDAEVMSYAGRTLKERALAKIQPVTDAEEGAVVVNRGLSRSRVV
ncbi:MAG TPA: hypothetical protein VF840_07485 [Terriglobales bacterium]